MALPPVMEFWQRPGPPVPKKDGGRFTNDVYIGFSETHDPLKYLVQFDDNLLLLVQLFSAVGHICGIASS